MKAWFFRCTLVASLIAVAWIAPAQRGAGGGGPGRSPDADPQHDVQLPNGKSQRDEILKAERDQNIKDAAQLVDLAQQLQVELEKNDRYVFSVATLKKTDEIEKLVRKIRSRMRHN